MVSSGSRWGAPPTNSQPHPPHLQPDTCVFISCLRGYDLIFSRTAFLPTSNPSPTLTYHHPLTPCPPHSLASSHFLSLRPSFSLHSSFKQSIYVFFSASSALNHVPPTLPSPPLPLHHTCCILTWESSQPPFPFKSLLPLKLTWCMTRWASCSSYGLLSGRGVSVQSVHVTGRAVCSVLSVCLEHLLRLHSISG